MSTVIHRTVHGLVDAQDVGQREMRSALRISLVHIDRLQMSVVAVSLLEDGRSAIVFIGELGEHMLTLQAFKIESVGSCWEGAHACTLQLSTRIVRV